MLDIRSAVLGRANASTVLEASGGHVQGYLLLTVMLQELDTQRATSVSSQVKRLAPPLPRIPESIFENLEVESSRSRNISTCGWSCCGGILLILISFWTLGWNEATNSPKENSLVYAFHHARNASCEYVDENNNDRLMWLSCPVIASPILAEDAPLEIRATLSDAGLELRGTQLEWWVQMMQWTEVKVCRGSRKSKCIYRYEKAFRHYDVDPSTFHCATKIRSGCSEVAPAEQPQSKLAELGRPEVLHGVVRAAPDSVIIGNLRNGYLLSRDLISQIDTKAEVQLINADGAAALLSTSRDLYTDLTLNESSARTYVATPRLGDLRLRVSASRSDFVSVIGKQEAGGRLGPYVMPTIRRSEPIEWLLSGDHADLQSLLHYHSREDCAAFWRFLGVLLMWLGTALLLSPLGEAEPSCMAVLCVACFAGAVLSSLLATISATLFASLPVELFMAAIGVAAAVFAWRSYRSSRGSYYEYYYGSDVSVEMPLVAGGPYDDDDDHVHWFERRLDNRCIDSSDDEEDDVSKGGLSSKGRQSRPLPLYLPSMAPRMVALDAATLKLPSDCWTRLSALGDLNLYEDTKTPEEVIERAKDADIVLTNKVPLGRDVLSSLPSLKMISVLATGYDMIDIRSLQHGQIVSNVPDYSTDSTAQQTVALVLEICNSVGMHNAAVHAGEWNKEGLFWFRKHEMLELGPDITIGIVGLGTIGTRVYELLRPFGCQFLAWSPDTRKELPHLSYTNDVGELFQRSNLVTLHCKLTPQNYGFVNGPLLHRMQPGSILVNAARGALVNEQDLADALNSGHLAAAAVDVVSHEPISDENPLLRARNCIITPHMAWTSPEARRRCLDIATSNVEAFLSGSPANVVASG